MDYDYPGPYNVTIPAGQTRLVLTISITNDSENEGTENFTVIISSANLHPNVSIGSINTTLVSIVDDIGKERWYNTYQFAISDYLSLSSDKFCPVGIHHHRECRDLAS